MRIVRMLIFCAAVACMFVPLSSARVLDGGSLTISAPGPAEADGPAGHSMSYSVTETGYDVTCDGPGGGTAADTLSVTAPFPVGDTIVNCRATDGITGLFTVTVTDTTAPVIDQPSNVTAEATSPAGASVTYPTVNATDIVDGTIAASCSPGSGTTFAFGQTTVTCNAIDTHGNAATPKSFTVTVTDTTAPIIDQPSNVTAAAINSSGASVTYPTVNATDNLDGTVAASCSPGSGSSFALGPTIVNCNATDTHGNAATPKSFTVTVSDTTAPIIDQPSNVTASATGPSGASVPYPKVNATDNVDGTIAASCSPGSGTTFALGPTTVTCNATDAAGNPAAPKSFTVTVKDTTAPVITQPSNQTAEATGPSGAAVSYPPVNATDAVDGTIAASCSPASGTTFALGPKTVTCNATDAAGNPAAPESFTVTVKDTTAPVVTQPSNQTNEATGPSGAAVSYPAVTASDNVDGTITASCSPASGLTFALGPTTVTCNATDAHGNAATPKSFTVTVTDKTPPALSPVANIKREANSAAGSIVNFASPVANDVVDGVVPAVVCVPASGTLFALGTKTVNCTARDARGNEGATAFQVSVVDTTPPVLTVPGDTTIYANTPEGVSAKSKGGAAFLLTASASDSVDPAPMLTNNAPSFFPVGITFVTWTAKDASGNVTVKSAKLTVLPMPAAGTTPPELLPPPDRIPPDDVGSLAAKGAESSVQLKWSRPKATDFDHVVVTRETADGGSPDDVYQGSATSFVDKGLQNGVEYRYLVVAYDKSGNRSTGVAVVAMPKAVALLSPKGGAHIKKSAKKTTFRWKGVKDARYYNLQVYVGGELVFASSRAGSKVLSVWPVRPSFVLTRQWKYAGKRYELTSGLYTWYVWPGIGPRSAAEYGPLIGSSSFRIVR